MKKNKIKKEANYITSPAWEDKDKAEFINMFIEYEAYGRIYINYLKDDKNYKFSPDIFTPPDPLAVKEFGYNLSSHAFEKHFFKMIEDLIVALVKIQVLNEAFVFRTSSFMARIVRPQNHYPRYFCKEEIDLLNGYEKAEIVFFCRSKRGEKRLQNRLDNFLNGNSIQDFVEKIFDSNFVNLAERVDKDPDMIFITALSCYMARNFVKNHKDLPFWNAINGKKE